MIAFINTIIVILFCISLFTGINACRMWIKEYDVEDVRIEWTISLISLSLFIFLGVCKTSGLI